MNAVPELPRKLGRYVLLSRLHGGGMTEVYLARLAREVGPGRMLVIKILPNSSEDDPDAEARFLEEARIVLNLSHGNITTAFEFGREEGRPFLVMEYLPGPSLHRLLKLLRKDGKRIQIGDALFIAREVCRALSYAHSFAVPGSKFRGLVHRDISPDNILISVSGHVKLTDFGIALFSQTGQQEPIWGKAAYIAPEMIAGEMPKPSSDIYSLGAVLYECLTGKAPLVGKNDVETMSLVRSKLPEPPSNLREDCAEDLDHLVLTLLSKTPAKRPSATGLVGQLTRLLARSHSSYSETSLAGAVSEYCDEEDYLSPGRGQQIRAVVLQAGGMLRGENTGEIISGSTVPLDDSVQSLPSVPPPAASSARPSAARVPLVLAAAGVALLLVFLAVLYFDGNPPVFSAPNLEESQLSKKTGAAENGERKTSDIDSTEKSTAPTSAALEKPEKPVKAPEAKPKRVSVSSMRKSALRRHSGTRPASNTAKFGWININSYPWSYVTVDGRKLEGHTPYKRVKLKAGKHVLLFENPGLGLKASREVEVGAEEEINVGVRLKKKQ